MYMCMNMYNLQGRSMCSPSPPSFLPAASPPSEELKSNVAGQV